MCEAARVQRATHSYVMSRLRISGTIPPPLPYDFMVCTWTVTTTNSLLLIQRVTRTPATRVRYPEPLTCT
jgi:hypothetical protein